MSFNQHIRNGRCTVGAAPSAPLDTDTFYDCAICSITFPSRAKFVDHFILPEVGLGGSSLNTHGVCSTSTFSGSAPKSGLLSSTSSPYSHPLDYFRRSVGCRLYHRKATLYLCSDRANFSQQNINVSIEMLTSQHLDAWPKRYRELGFAHPSPCAKLCHIDSYKNAQYFREIE
jgi:hypothetical protein